MGRKLPFGCVSGKRMVAFELRAFSSIYIAFRTKFEEGKVAGSNLGHCRLNFTKYEQNIIPVSAQL